MVTEAQLIADYRAANPGSRAEGIIKYVRNGGTVKQRGCVLCGEMGPTWCGTWKKTKVARDWEEVHLRSHLV